MSPASARFHLSNPDTPAGGMKFAGLAASLDEAMGRPEAWRIECLDSGQVWVRDGKRQWTPEKVAA